MKASERSTQLTKAFESCRLVAYWDGTYLDRPVNKVKRWSLGWGHTLNVREGDTCTQEQADEWFALNQEQAATQLSQSLWWASNTPLRGQVVQNMFDALVDFVYNLGIGEFGLPSSLNGGSVLRRLLKGGLFKQAAEEFLRWKWEHGEVSNGLLRRRLAERALFLGDFKADGSLRIEMVDFPDAEWTA